MSEQYRFREFYVQIARSLRETHTTKGGEKLRVSDVRAVMQAMIDELEKHLVNNPNEPVRLPGLGCFSLRERPPETKTNPFTKEPMKLPRRWHLKFRTYDSFTRKLQRQRRRKRKDMRSTVGNAFLDDSGLTDD